LRQRKLKLRKKQYLTNWFPQARAKAASKPKGTLGGKLEAQKKQTRTDTLEAASKDTRRMRDSDAAADTRAYN